MKQIKHALEILIAFNGGKKLEFFDSGCWLDSIVSSLEQLKANLFDKNMGRYYRIKQEPFKVIVDELYKFNDYNLDSKNRNECNIAFNEGKTIQYKPDKIWLDFSLETLPKIGSEYTYLSFKLYEKLFSNNSTVTKSELRIKPETVKVCSRRALFKSHDKYYITSYNYLGAFTESEIANLSTFIKWIEDKQEHEIEV